MGFRRKVENLEVTESCSLFFFKQNRYPLTTVTILFLEFTSSICWLVCCFVLCKWKFATANKVQCGKFRPKFLAPSNKNWFISLDLFPPLVLRRLAKKNLNLKKLSNRQLNFPFPPYNTACSERNDWSPLRKIKSSYVTLDGSRMETLSDLHQLMHWKLE